MESATRKPLQVFISYAHQDEDLCGEFIKHLRRLRQDRLIQYWHDRRITGGSDWARQIDEHLNSAGIIVLLVSLDYLASGHCLAEMRRGMERHDAGEARVVPVILKPCEWETSQFGKLNVLPTHGKPVVEWESHHQGLLDVTKGLRRIAQEVQEQGRRGGLPASAARLKFRPWQLAVAGCLALPLIALGFLWTKQRQYVAQGDDLLNVGHYEEARASYREALRWYPLSRAASLGLKISDLAKPEPNLVSFARQLDRLLREAPKDPHLKVLEGDYLTGRGLLDEAMDRYQAAAKLDPALAEAYFRMGVLYDLRGDMAGAMRMFKRAVELAPSSPHYACNLADQCFKHGEYTEALSVYGGIRQFPLAALESAKIHRLLGELTDANEQERIAMEWMGEPSVANTPENRLPWWFDYGGAQPVSLSSDGEKSCYAHLELSATRYLDRDEDYARGEADRAARDCGARLRAVKAVVRWELERVAREQPDLAGRAAAYGERFLAE